ncbi:membrane protein insertase YidC [Paraferrimonas sp. SM1919]|uniref:membrane protein insertase YidC n=1 Tax=Paraferrimonas sp. SM1919 TaxID=2662263 RepID=UPI0013D817E9|nr:membrane protein insertase YidC [Paraferrimonas sp. SM1919]
MESQRNILLIGLLLVSFFLFQAWQEEQNPQPVTAPQTQSTTTTANTAINSDVPMAETSIAQATVNSAELISVKTDQFDLKINPVGGDIVAASLLQHQAVQGEQAPFVLLEQGNNFTYIAQSGLIGKDGIDTTAGRAAFSSEQTSYELAEDQDQLKVTLTLVADNGVNYQKYFIFSRGKGQIKVGYQIENTTAAPLQMQMYGQLKQSITQGEGSMMMPVYRGGAYSTADVNYEKYDFADMGEEDLDKRTIGGWVAMLQHYFVSAWVPPASDQNLLFSRINAGGLANIGYRGALINVAPNSTQNIEADLYVGPKYQDQLSDISESLNLVVDYGFLWWLAEPIHWLLMLFQGLVVNWGAAIIMVTLAVRGALYPLTKAQYTSMAKMRQLQPKLKQLQDRYADDRQKLGQAMMELYKKEKVNPMGGCLPILLQMPIFIALYWVLLESVELRHAPFMLWITDLSVQDPYYVLPLLMGASMFLMQKMQPMPANMDPMQQKMMQYMPVVFTIFFLWFPAGLVLYWLVGNLVAIAQQMYIYKALDKQGLK